MTLLSILLASGFQVGFIQDYNVTNQAETSSGRVKVRVVQARHKQAELRISIYEFPTKQAAMESAKLNEAQLLSIYEARPESYFSMITRAINCPKKYLPQREEVVDASGPAVFSLYANSRNTFGACTQNTATKRAAVATLVCKTNFIEIKKFAPAESWTKKDLDELRSLSCAR